MKRIKKCIVCQREFKRADRILTCSRYCSVIYTRIYRVLYSRWIKGNLKEKEYF